MSRFDRVREALAEQNPDALLADGLAKALIGYTANQHGQTHAVYDVDKCIVALMREGMSHEEAVEYFEFNTLGAYVGENGPIYVQVVR